MSFRLCSISLSLESSICYRSMLRCTSACLDTTQLGKYTLAEGRAHFLSPAFGFIAWFLTVAVRHWIRGIVELMTRKPVSSHSGRPRHLSIKRSSLYKCVLLPKPAPVPTVLWFTNCMLLGRKCWKNIPTAGVGRSSSSSSLPYVNATICSCMCHAGNIQLKKVI